MNMKSNILAAGTCGLLLLATVGCGKQDSPAAPATPSSPSASSATRDARSAMGAATAQATQAVAQVAQAADKVAADAQKAAAAGAADAAKLAESTIDSIKKLVGENKYQEALTALQEAAKLQLTPAQKKTVDDLTAQVQKLLVTDPAKAVGGLLPPKPN